MTYNYIGGDNKELYERMLLKIVETKPEIVFADAEVKTNILKTECYNALVKIREILTDDTLNDAECFNKIEAIVCVFESLGSGGGIRHDFG